MDAHAGIRPVTPHAGVLLAPNPSPMTLTGTNTWVLASRPGGSCVLVDPGPLDDDHVAALSSLPVELILLTHHHDDHSAAIDVVHQATGAPVRAVDPSLCRAGAPLAAGATLRAAGITLEVIATPGHTADSVCFLLPEDPAVLTGDTVLGAGTSVVAHPAGRLGDYLSSLRILGELRGVALLPGHGPELPDCAAAADYYLDHRLRRLDQVREALAAGVRTAADVVAVVYADVDRTLWPAAELSVLAQLSYLRELGEHP